MTEHWKQIEGFENYEVSDHGRVRNKKTNKMVKAYDSGGRMSVTMCTNEKKFGRRLHNLVAQAFVPNPKQKEYVYHANRERANCRADNLFWISGPECTLVDAQHWKKFDVLQEFKTRYQPIA